MRSMRKVVVLVMLTGALCADRAITSLPQLGPQIAQMARRLTSGFRRVVRVAQVYVAGRRGGAALSPMRAFFAGSAEIVPIPLSPFQFRLPPPVA